MESHKPAESLILPGLSEDGAEGGKRHLLIRICKFFVDRNFKLCKLLCSKIIQKAKDLATHYKIHLFYLPIIELFHIWIHSIYLETIITGIFVYFVWRTNNDLLTGVFHELWIEIIDHIFRYIFFLFNNEYHRCNKMNLHNPTIFVLQKLEFNSHVWSNRSCLTNIKYILC